MENKFINRYNTFCKSLQSCKKQNSRPQDRFCSRRNCSQFQSYFRHLLESYERYSDQKNGNSWFCSWLSTRNSAAGIYQWYYWWWHLATNAEIQKSFVSWLRWYFRRREISGHYKYLLSSFWKIQKRCCEIL